MFRRSESRGGSLWWQLLVPGVRGLVLDRLADEGRRWARRDAECAPSSLPPSDVLQDVHHQRPSTLPVDDQDVLHVHLDDDQDVLHVLIVDDQDVLHVPESTAFVKLKHISCALHAQSYRIVWHTMQSKSFSLSKNSANIKCKQERNYCQVELQHLNRLKAFFVHFWNSRMLIFLENDSL